MSDRSTIDNHRPPYGVAVAVGSFVLLVYLLTIAPTTQFWDTSEYIAAAKVLGIPHPPGNPLFVLLANVWGKIPIVPHYALRINLFSAFCSATASALLFLVTDRWLLAWIADRTTRWIIAAGGILVGATSFTVWHQSVVNAKVYTLSLLSIALVLWLTVRWGDLQPGPRRNRLLLVIVYLVALSATNHLMGLLIVPAVIAYLAFSEPHKFIDWRFMFMKLGPIAVALSVFAFIVIRARHFPAINEGEPTTWDAFWSVLARHQYQKPPVTERQASLYWQFVNYFQYFSWQFGRDWPIQLQAALATLFGGLGLHGLWSLFGKMRREGTALFASMATFTAMLIIYLNFKYGYSIRGGEALAREVRERDYFFVASFQLWGVCCALGIGATVSWIREHLSPTLPPRVRNVPLVAAAVICLVPLAGNRLTASRSHERLARQFAIDMLNSVEPYAILVTAGDNDMFPLWYAQEVERVRRDVLLANQSLMNTPWHLRQIQRRIVDDFDPAAALGPYAGISAARPDAPPYSLSMEQIDSLPPAVQLGQNSILNVGEVEFLVSAGLISRSDLALMQLIQDNLGRRPIYFARTTGGYADAHGLTPFLVGHGLARKLETRNVEGRPGLVFSRTLGWIDLNRSKQLLFDVYVPEEAARERPRGWTDPPSNPVLALYAVTYREMATLLLQSGQPEDRELAARAQELAERMMGNLR
ncbi:MAG: DUF2723 domain-containing protein [Gemmatimonadales bacterium]